MEAVTTLKHTQPWSQHPVPLKWKGLRRIHTSRLASNRRSGIWTLVMIILQGEQFTGWGGYKSIQDIGMHTFNLPYLAWTQVLNMKCWICWVIYWLFGLKLQVSCQVYPALELIYDLYVYILQPQFTQGQRGCCYTWNSVPLAQALLADSVVTAWVMMSGNTCHQPCAPRPFISFKYALCNNSIGILIPKYFWFLWHYHTKLMICEIHMREFDCAGFKSLCRRPPTLLSCKECCHILPLATFLPVLAAEHAAFSEWGNQLRSSKLSSHLG